MFLGNETCKVWTLETVSHQCAATWLVASAQVAMRAVCWLRGNSLPLKNNFHLDAPSPRMYLHQSPSLLWIQLSQAWLTSITRQLITIDHYYHDYSPLMCNDHHWSPSLLPIRQAQPQETGRSPYARTGWWENLQETIVLTNNHGVSGRFSHRCQASDHDTTILRRNGESARRCDPMLHTLGLRRHGQGTSQWQERLRSVVDLMVIWSLFMLWLMMNH